MKLFLNACGLTEMLRLRIEDRNRSDSFQMTFPRPYVLIGRNPETDLTLDHWQVSRRHSYLQILDGRLYCLDLGSRTGTLWEGRPSRWRWLALQQTIHIGPYRISCESFDTSPTVDEHVGEVLPPSTGQLPGARLEPIDDPSLEVWEMEDALALIGRSPACQIRLPDPNLSKFHASLVRTSLGIWVIDLLGTGGLSVNRKRVRCYRLADGDELMIGRYRFRLLYTDPQALAGVVDEEPVESMGSDLVRRNNEAWSPAQTPATTSWNGTPATVLPFETRGVPESVMIVQAMLTPMLNQFAIMQQQMFEQFHQTMIAMIQSMHVMHQDRMDVIQKELDEVHRLTKELHALQVEASRNREAEKESAVSSTGQSRAVEPKPSDHPAIPRPKERLATAQPCADMHATLHQRITNLQSERQSRWQKILGMVGGQSDGSV